mgnify:FL=1
MGQLIEAGARINGRYNASRGFGPWATQAEAERGLKSLKTELEYKQRYIEYLENRNGILTEENNRLAARQKAHLREKMKDYEKPRITAQGVGLGMALIFCLGALMGVGMSILAVVLA